MVKFLPLVLLMFLTIGVLVYVRVYRVSQDNPAVDPLTALTENFQLTESSQAAQLPPIVTTLAPVAKENLTPVSTKNEGKDPSLTTLQTQVKSLERIVADLQIQINDLKETPTTTPVAKTPLYIPLGTGGVSSATDWTAVDALQVTLDPVDYPGYKSMQLEVSLRVYQGNGTAYARLYNSDDKLAIIPSEVSSTTENYSWVTSSGFTLSSGKKSYKIQLKTNTGYEAGVQSARIKVNF